MGQPGTEVSAFNYLELKQHQQGGEHNSNEQDQTEL